MGTTSFEFSYLLILALLAGAILFALGPLIIAAILGPKKQSATKNATYECGLVSKGDAWVQFRVQYYIFALIFVVFDLETVFLFPWAVAFNSLGMFAFIEMLIFIAILAGGLVYAWGKGVLEWK
jgi:NADH:ubiquinone oxidoreductase subunit 3 (subunit A)